MSAVLTQPGQADGPAGQQPPAMICIVDDSPTICAIVALALESLGYTVAAFATGPAFLHWLSQQQRRPALLLLDIELPKMDGYTVAQQIRQHPRFQAMPLVMISNRDSTTARLKAGVAGAQAYLTKPFVVQHLSQIVQTLLAPGSSRPATATETSRETH